MPLNSGTKLGPYEIQTPLGAGGMGEVYRARDTRLDRTVAVKVLASHLSSSPELKQRLEREARAMLARLDRVKPFAVQETMLPAAALSPAAQTGIEHYLISGRRTLRYGWHEIVDDPCGVALEVARVNRRRAIPFALMMVLGLTALLLVSWVHYQP